MIRGITVIDVCRLMGVETTPELTWGLGAAVRELYEERHGVPPPKDLRPKTNGEGSHCFAVYPIEFRDEIEKMIRRYKIEQARQGRFDF